MTDVVQELKELIKKSKNIVFFGGAGVSTESNIPDFRSPEGLYHAQQEYGMSPEEMISHSFFLSETPTFFKYYKENLIYKEAEPNKAHLVLAELEKQGKLKAIVTQNIDGLHQKAGNKNVYELHGSVARNICMDCGEKFDVDYILDENNCEDYVPKCNKCGGIIKPDVVLYEEALDDKTVNGALEAIKQADLLIVGGTSLVVYPAAGMIHYFHGDKLVLINKTPTLFDSKADLIIHNSIGTILSLATEEI